MATKAPMATIHRGMLTGRLNASRTPVMMAEPSHIVGFCRSRYFCIRYSKIRQAATETAVTMMAPQPKKITEQMNAGIRAIKTPYMFFSTESPLWMWGESDMVKLLISNSL